MGGLRAVHWADLMATGLPGVYSLWEAAVNERATCYALD
jgi:arginyl-tRNA--protein-N-Asp/Glu arginylyltransferase